MELDRKAIAAEEFKHQSDAFRSWVDADNTSPFPLAQGRYHLYISLACPWASRTFIVQKLKRLEQAVGVTVADPIRDERGWAFRDGPGFSRDPINGFQFFSEAYLATDAQYCGRVSVPVLWDKQARQIVNNSEDDICRMFNDVFSPLGDGGIDLSILRALFPLGRSWSFSVRTGANVWRDRESFEDGSTPGKCSPPNCRAFGPK